MRIGLAVLLILHGIAHLPGFLAPWRLANLKDMPYKTTLFVGLVDLGDAGIRMVGILWLAAGLSLAICGVGAIARVPWWPAATLIAASFSLLLSLAEWPQARTGVFVNAAILALVVIGKQVGWLRAV